MKRVTVAITVGDYPYAAMKEIRTAMINAGVQAATLRGAEIYQLDAKVGTPHKAKP